MCVPFASTDDDRMYRPRWLRPDGSGPPADPADPDDRDNWAGGYYELAVGYMPADEVFLREASRLLEEVAGRESGGVVRLPSGQRVVCTSGWLVEAGEDGEPDPAAGGCITFDLPLGALVRADPRVGAYPFGDVEDSMVWRRPLDDWLATVALRLLKRVPFAVALIGCEVSAELLDVYRAENVPAVRSAGIISPGPPPAYYPATV
jgi:hypothetical protein